MKPAVIVDAGPLYAYIDADDADHHRCAEFLACHNGTLIVPALVITEVCYLVQTRLGTRAELLFLGDLASGAFSVEPVAVTDWFRVIELS
ncbi:MAG: type II toxin-antitoxin system VapC family toxin [Pseudonocardiaceae bacterium]